ncbi:transmembrane sensor [Azospirillum agricola]|uniref:FecR family protein n=1 Tax=Azospirillum agricola TaxID=1720247 RepID=UPI002D7E8982|nr:FecR domain-containing protein [Azospirillum agricola]MBP2233149.1 transmembrane sensor [Azospirillum agricola]
MEQEKTAGPEAAGSGGAGPYRHADPVVDAALDWFVAFQGGASDGETLAAYRAWRESDARHAQAFDRLAAMSGMPELHAATLAATTPPSAGGGPVSPAALATVVPFVHAQGVRSRSPSRRAGWGARWRSLAAAALLAVVGLNLYPELMLRWTADHRTAAGERREIALPDGSRLTLDTGSAVALDFAEGRRGVRMLRGEGYFDVISDPSRPFRVTAGFSMVEVTGTAFAVRADDAADSVVLERGRVSVSPLDEPGRPVALAPGDRVTATALGLSAVARTEPANALAWREGRYIFHQQPFAAVVDNLRRYYPGLILVLDHRTDGERVSGNYRLDDPAAALRSVAAIAGVRMTTLPGGLIVFG